MKCVPGAEARTSRQLDAQQPSKWAQSHSSCSCHNTGQLLSKLMLCTHNTTTYPRACLLFAFANPAASDKVYSLLLHIWSKLRCQWEVEDQSLTGRCCLTCETLKCVANLGLSSCCPHPVCVFLDGGSLMFQKDCSLLTEVLKISCPQDCGYQPAASPLILMLLLTFMRGKILTLKLLQNQQMYILRSLCTGGHSLPERIESICLLHATITFNPRCFRVAELCFYKYASS